MDLMEYKQEGNFTHNFRRFTTDKGNKTMISFHEVEDWARCLFSVWFASKKPNLGLIKHKYIFDPDFWWEMKWTHICNIVMS